MMSAASPSARKKPRFLRVVFIVVKVLFAAGLLGTVVGVVRGIGAVCGDNVEPSLKVRRLAEGISEAMNGASFAVV